MKKLSFISILILSLFGSSLCIAEPHGGDGDYNSARRESEIDSSKLQKQLSELESTLSSLNRSDRGISPVMGGEVGEQAEGVELSSVVRN